VHVPEVFVTFTELVSGPDGRQFVARACGSLGTDGLWQGWVEFSPLDAGVVLRSQRETTQPNRQDLRYWATGLTPVYLEGSLARTLSPPATTAPPPAPVSAYDGPASHIRSENPASAGVLNPFSVYRKGEALLRRQLGALSGWHLINVIRGYELSEQTDRQLGALTDAELVELIVIAVRLQPGPRAGP
jgi:hypothetical protein